jgi:mannose-1-phosphate guanylyltransferase
MIEWVLAHLAAHGVDEAVLSMGFRPDTFQRSYPEGRCAGVELRFAIEPEPLDTAGAIRFAADSAKITERFVVFNGDVLTDLDVSALVAFHDSHRAAATIALHQVEDPSRYGVVPTDDCGRVLAFVEKPPPGEAPTDRINAGTYVLEPEVLQLIAPERRVSVERETFPALVAEQWLYAMDDGGVYWLDTGTPASYIQAQLDVIDGCRDAAPVSPIAGSARVAPTARVQRSVVGPDAVVGPAALLDEAVVMAGATVGEGATVRHSIVGPCAEVGEGATIIDLTVVGDGALVPAGASLAHARVPEID